LLLIFRPAGRKISNKKTEATALPKAETALGCDGVSLSIIAEKIEDRGWLSSILDLL
jgi:hypothetical protein